MNLINMAQDIIEKDEHDEIERLKELELPEMKNSIIEMKIINEQD